MRPRLHAADPSGLKISGSAFLSVLALLLCLGLATPAAAQDLHLTLNHDQPLFTRTPALTVAGTTDAPAGSRVEVKIGPATHEAVVGEGGSWRLEWPEPLAGGQYTVTARVTDAAGRSAVADQPLIVQLPGRLARGPLLPVGLDYDSPVESAAGDFQEFTDRWRIVPPPYELNVQSRGKWDPYHQNRLKGDIPWRGTDIFLNVSAVSDTLVEVRQLPTPSGVSAARPGSFGVFGRDGQAFGFEQIALSADLFKGDTAFKPIEWRVKGTVVADLNALKVAENAVVRPDVRDGTSRVRGFLALQELFGEWKLKDLSPNFDFVSVRAGIQPFNSDFRGFVFTDTNFGVRLFGNYESNRDQYNLAVFDRLEKDTNSGLNTFDRRHQQVAVANFYRQDFLTPGYTAQASIHYLRDEATFSFDKNGFLARPDPVGSAQPHEIEAVYLGLTGSGHVGRINVENALYFVTGRDSLNPIAGPAPPLRDDGDRVDIRAFMGALELSIDRDWYRPKLAYFYASGDRDPVDRRASGFDSIFDNPAFAGGGFSFWNRMGIRLAGSGVALVNRGSLLPDLRSSKEEGQPNFVNPGLQLASVAVDLDLTPKLRAALTANYLRFDHTETLELVLFQSPIHREIGWDLSAGVRYRPYLNQNVVVVGGLAALLPGRGFEDIYEKNQPLFAAFTDLVLTF
ncbi:MAG: Ig-like domain-containing protein [Thermoanaerobaculia bacterium]